jgi:hypothetical protein
MCVMAGCLARARLVPFAPAWARGAITGPYAYPMLGVG